MEGNELGILEDLVARFDGEAGKRRLQEVLSATELVQGNTDIALALTSVAKLAPFGIGASIMEQDKADNDLYFVLVGSVTIERNQRPGPVRFAGAHFGEMSVVDLRAVRSATVRARENCVLARVSEAEFSSIADKFPILWRRMAAELGSRLRQRLADIPERNEKPMIFIGSSRERLEVATKVRDILSRKGFDIQLWSTGVFDASATAIESLEGAVRSSDFGILVLAPDDEVISRGQAQPAPRDNIVFELGLFMGALGRRRTFALVPPQATKIPSDLFGVTPLKYDDSSGSVLQSSLDAVGAAIAAIVAKLGPK